MSIPNRSLFAIAVTLQLFSVTVSAEPPSEKDLIVGRITHEQVLRILDQWKIDGRPEPLAVRDLEGLRRVRQGATVKVFLGAWCEDSKSVLSRFVRLLDALENDPFTVEYVAVDGTKQQPASEVQSNEIWYLPTFVVLRSGREVGRIVEHPPHALERDLLLLLDGTTHGLLSSNENAIIRYLSASVDDSQ